MRAKKEIAATPTNNKSNPKWCFLLKLYKWEPVVYLEFEKAYEMMIAQMEVEECSPNKTKDEILFELGKDRECVVRGLVRGFTCSVEVLFQKLPLVINSVKYRA